MITRLKRIVSILPTPTVSRQTQQYCNSTSHHLRTFSQASFHKRKTSHIRNNDWICPKCNNNVFASKQNCFKCNTAKPVVTKVTKSTNQQDRLNILEKNRVARNKSDAIRSEQRITKALNQALQQVETQNQTIASPITTKPIQEVTNQNRDLNTTNYISDLSKHLENNQIDQAIKIFQLAQTNNAVNDTEGFLRMEYLTAFTDQGCVEPALEMFETTSVNWRHYNVMLNTICNDHSQARAIYLKAIAQGIYHTKHDYCSTMDVTTDSKEGDMPKLDLHKHSYGAAETAFFWWLEKISKSKIIVNNLLITELIVVTGRGNKSENEKAVVRKTISSLLQEMQLPMMVSNNPGNFIIDFRKMMMMNKKLIKIRKKMKKNRMKKLYDWDSTTNTYHLKSNPQWNSRNVTRR